MDVRRRAIAAGKSMGNTIRYNTEQTLTLVNQRDGLSLSEPLIHEMYPAFYHNIRI